MKDNYECWAVLCFTDGKFAYTEGIEERWSREHAHRRAQDWNNEVNNSNGATFKPVRVRVTVEEVEG